MKCFYHKSDLDGHCSGAIVKKKYPECEMIGVDYGDDICLLNGKTPFEKHETIFIVDFSFDRKTMIELLDMKYDIYWIDHHKSAIEKLNGINVKGVREIGKAGCELTWEFLFPYEMMPTAVELLGRYDVWDHKNPDVLPFQYGIRTRENTLPDSEIWEYYLLPNPGGVKELIILGKIILDYQTKQDQMYAQGMAFETMFEGHRAIAINKAFCNSKIFDMAYEPEKHDIMIAFSVKDGQWKYSLYSAKDEIDVSILAVKHGGGGHKGAAGFMSNRYELGET